MTYAEAVTLIIERFPILRQRVDDLDDLFEMPYVTYGLLASELLENPEDEVLFGLAAQFVDELANSGDDLLEELLVLDILEGIAQDRDLANKFRTKITPKAVSLLENVEKAWADPSKWKTE
jgi:hypothetical protein